MLKHGASTYGFTKIHNFEQKAIMRMRCCFEGIVCTGWKCLLKHPHLLVDARGDNGFRELGILYGIM